MSIIDVAFWASHVPGFARLKCLSRSRFAALVTEASIHISHNSESCPFLAKVPYIQTPSKTSRTMVQELSYNVTSHVIESWEQLRRIKNYEEVAGVVLFQRCVRVILPFFVQVC